MKLHGIAILSLALGSPSSLAADLPLRSAGINMSDAAYWSPNQFTNLARQIGRTWVSQNPPRTDPFDLGLSLQRNNFGFPVIPGGLATATLVKGFDALGNALALSGEYLVCFESTAPGVEIQFHWASEAKVVTSGARIQIQFENNENKNSLLVKPINTRTQPSALTRLELLPTALVQTCNEPYATFHPMVTAVLSAFQSVRTLDLTKPAHRGLPERTTADSVWSDRVSAQHHTVDDTPAPWETIAELGHVLFQQNPGKSLWINVPCRARENYMTGLATFLRDALPAGLKLRVEFCNETWNWSFQSTHDLKDEAAARYPEMNPYDAHRVYMVELNRMLSTVFRTILGASRVDITFGFHHANAWQTEEYMRLGMGQDLDSIATAPYFACDTVDDATGQTKWNEIRNLSSSEFRERCERDMLNAIVPRMRAHQDIAQRYRKRLIAYEGGPHLVAGSLDVAEREREHNYYLQFNRSPEMTYLTYRWLQEGEQSGYESIHFYNLIATPNIRGGIWGLFETFYVSDLPAKAKGLAYWLLGL